MAVQRVGECDFFTGLDISLAVNEMKDVSHKRWLTRFKQLDTTSSEYFLRRVQNMFAKV